MEPGPLAAPLTYGEDDHKFNLIKDGRGKLFRMFYFSCTNFLLSNDFFSFYGYNRRSLLWTAKIESIDSNK